MRQPERLGSKSAQKRLSPLLVLPAVVVLVLAAFLAGGHATVEPVRAQAGQTRTWQQTDVRRPSYDTGGMLDPRGVSRAPGGRFFVADRGHDRIVVVDASGSIADSFGGPGDGPAEFEGPTDVAVDSARGRVYVADEGNRRLSVFSLDGVFIEAWRSAGPDHAFVPRAVAVSPLNGDVYVVSRLPWGRIDRFTADGRWLDGWGEIGGGPRQYRSPEDIAVHTDGRVLVADTLNGRVQVLDAGGRYLSDIEQLPGVVGVDVDPGSGEIYALFGTDSVGVYTAAGAPLRIVRSSDLGEGFEPGRRVAVGDNGRMAVTTGFGARDGRHGLRQYSPGGALEAATLVDPLDHSGFLDPSALDVGADGTLYVLDTPLRTTKRYAADGALLARYDEASGHEVTVGPGGDIYVVSAPPSGPTRMRRVGSDGRMVWESTCECYSGLGLAATSQRVFVTEALTQTIGWVPVATGGEPGADGLGVAETPYAWPLDIALGPDGRLYVAGGEAGRIDVFDEGGSLVGGWRIGDGLGAERISVGPDGTVFALLLDGSLAAYRSDGALEASWTPEVVPGADAVMPRDLAAAPGGRLYVLDGHSGSILVYEPRAAAMPTATPESTPSSPCTVSGTKTASPGAIVLGDEVTVELTLDIRCPEGTKPRADVMLVLDRSNSMAGDKLRDAKRAASTFVDGLDLSRHRVGLVTFSSIVSLDQALTADGDQVKSAIDQVQAHGATDIAAAEARALRHLATSGRPDALGVILLLTDGEPSGQAQAYVDTFRYGGRARARGVVVYAIGLGTNVDEELLVASAGSRERYFFAPDATELESIYRALSESVGAVIVTDVQVTDEMGPDVVYVPGSASGSPAETGRTVTWHIGAIPGGGIAPLTLRVRPGVTGHIPTNTRAVARYTAGGRSYTYTYPIPYVDVSDEPPPSPTIVRATATPTPGVSRPSTVYLPLAMRSGCTRSGRKPVDVIMVVDTSSSMRGEKLALAAEAATGFIGLMSSERDRVGLVTFNEEAHVVPLTTDLGAVAAELANLQTRRGTRIDLGLYAAVREFYDHGRADAARVAILVSDGRPSEGTRPGTIEQSDSLRAYGGELYVIGLGADADSTLLRWLADSPQHYYFAPSGDDLAAIYERIAVRLPCR